MPGDGNGGHEHGTIISRIGRKKTALAMHGDGPLYATPWNACMYSGIEACNERKILVINGRLDQWVIY